MQFNQVKEEIKLIPLEATRTDCDNYFEAVVVREEVSKLNERLKKFLGDPAWPSKNRLGFKVQEAINGFGGIMSGQTLYFKSEGENAIFAMLWPWQDGVRTTVKIIQK